MPPVSFISRGLANPAFGNGKLGPLQLPVSHLPLMGLPLLALRGVVWFPGVEFTLFVGTDVNVRVAASALVNRGQLAAFTLRDDRSQSPTTLGTLFEIGEASMAIAEWLQERLKKIEVGQGHERR